MDQDMKDLLRWMPVVIVLFSMAAGWGTFSTKIDVLAEEVEELRKEDDDHNEREAVDKAEIAVVKATQQAIKEDVEEIKERQKEQDKKLDKILDELRNQ